MAKNPKQNNQSQEVSSDKIKIDRDYIILGVIIVWAVCMDVGSYNEYKWLDSPEFKALEQKK